MHTEETSTHGLGNELDNWTVICRHLHSALSSHKLSYFICIQLFPTLFCISSLNWFFHFVLGLPMVLYMPPSFLVQFCDPYITHVHTTVPLISPTLPVVFLLSDLV